MIAKNNEFMQEATETLYELNADEIVRQLCLARQDFYRTQNAYKQRFAEYDKTVQELSLKNKVLSAEKTQLSLQNAKLLSQMNDTNKKLLELQAKLKQYEKQ